MSKSQNYLVSIGACKEGKDLCSGQALADAWLTTKRPDYWIWLMATSAGTAGWPTKVQVVAAVLAMLQAVQDPRIPFVTDGPTILSKYIAVAALNTTSPAVSMAQMATVMRTQIGAMAVLEALR